MSEPFVAELRIFSFNFPPKGWAFANGQLLPINQNQALFSLLGTTYGGNGQTTFALPNLQGRIPLHMGSGFNLGQVGGEQSHALTQAEIPSHTHPVTATSKAADQSNPSGNVWAQGNNAYNSAGDATMPPNAIGATGQNQPHDNMPPYLVLNIAIALLGIFPSRN